MDRVRSDDVDIKPCTQSKIDIRAYNPKGYLKPMQIDSMNEKTIDVNSIHLAKLVNRKNYI